MGSALGCGLAVVARFSTRVAAKAASGLPPERTEVFPKRIRLTKRAEFQRVYTSGDRVIGRYLVLFVMDAERASGRFGVTASRHVGSAVTRARCKRRLRELYRRHRQSAGLDGHDIVANARRGCASAPWSQLEADFRRCLSRVRRTAGQAPRA